MEKSAGCTRFIGVRKIYNWKTCLPVIYLLSTRVDLSFVVHNLAKFSVNPGKVHFEVLVHLLRYIRDNNTLGLKYYSDINNALVSDILRQASIKTENQLMSFSGSSWQYFPDIGRSTRAQIIFIKVVQLTMAHMFQNQLPNQVHKVSTM